MEHVHPIQRREKEPRTFEHVLEASIVPDDDEMDAAFELSGEFMSFRIKVYKYNRPGLFGLQFLIYLAAVPLKVISELARVQDFTLCEHEGLPQSG